MEIILAGARALRHYKTLKRQLSSLLLPLITTRLGLSINGAAALRRIAPAAALAAS